MSAELQQILLRSMILDVEALKPGNVGKESPGHGMDARMFVQSAELTAPILADNSFSPAERILQAVTATMTAVGCNTNLGIILLCTPLLAAMERVQLCRSIAALRLELAAVLADMDKCQHGEVYQAIRLASPGGLGSSERYDLHGTAGGEILAAMHHARNRDRIALQYCSAFKDIFITGWPCLSYYRKRWRDVAWALSACYISLLCCFADSHIQRRQGKKAARMVQGEACALQRGLLPAGPPADSELNRWYDLDSRCKQQGLNPGTTADLSVASLFVELWLDA